MDKKIITILLISFIILLSSIVFAFDYIPEGIIDNYYSTINLYNSSTIDQRYQGSMFYSIPENFMNKSFINNLLNDVEEKINLNNLSSELENLNSILISFDTSNKKIYFSFGEKVMSSSTTNLNLTNYIEFVYTYDENFNFNYLSFNKNFSTYKNYKSFTTSKSNVTKMYTIYLGLSTIQSFTFTNGYIYGSYFNYAQTIASSEYYPVVYTNKTYENNFVLNWNQLTGKQTNMEYDIFYYDEENNKISIKDLIYYNSTSTDLELNIKSYYITSENIKSLKSDTEFYLYTKFYTTFSYGETNTNYFVISENTTKMFETSSKNGSSGDNGQTGGSSGDSGQTGGSSTSDTDKIDLSNVENKLGDINTSIIDVGNKTNQNLDEIKQAIQKNNDLITQEPDISENDFKDSFPDVEIDDPSEDFFSWIFENIQNVFLNTEEQKFEIKLYTDNVYTISTNQIKVPDGTVKSLIGLSCDFGICYWILKDVRKTINKVKVANIEALAEDDITANMV